MIYVSFCIVTAQRYVFLTFVFIKSMSYIYLFYPVFHSAILLLVFASGSK
ncbi:putative membrane protein [Bacteroides fragilis str. S6L8]|nr:putative membrane protein [Bacteroides fragilis str. 1007-1-F \